jgi:ribosome-binding factor A
MPSVRLQKVADLIRDELARMLIQEVAETRQALVTVTGVALTADMRLARVHVSIFPEAAPRDQILSALQRHAGRLRHELGKVIRLRVTPDLEFRLDTSAEKGDRIEQLLRLDRGESRPGPSSAEEEE